MRTPGPDHPISVSPADTRWRAYFHGHVIADSADALVLKEADLRPVVYFPRGDVAMEYLTPTDLVTHCPFKGDASHFSLYRDGEVVEKAAWSYEAPFDAVGEINGRIAFYPDVEVHAVDDAQVNPHHRDADRDAGRADVDEVVKHTDSGSGASQRDHWPSNVEGPGPDGGVR